MAMQLGELERLRAEFVSVASHELKTPINVIIGYLELLQEGIYGELSTKQKEVLLTINKQAQTLTRLVKRLLDISRFEASGGKIEVRHVNLQRLLTTLESSFSVLANQRYIAFSIATVTVPFTVAPAAGAENAALSGGGPGGGVPPLATVTATDVSPVLPVASRTDAVSVCGPSGVTVVVHGNVTGPRLGVVVTATVAPATESV